MAVASVAVSEVHLALNHGVCVRVTRCATRVRKFGHADVSLAARTAEAVLIIADSAAAALPSDAAIR